MQQLLLGVLQPIFDPRFSETATDFGRDAARSKPCRAAQSYAREGYTWVVDMDITKFFDRVNHDILMHRMGQVVRDKAGVAPHWAFLRRER